MAKKGTYGKPQSFKSRLAAQRNWALLQVGGIRAAVAFLTAGNWIHPDCAKIMQRQCIRARQNINTAWRYKQMKILKVLIVDETSK